MVNFKQNILGKQVYISCWTVNILSSLIISHSVVQLAHVRTHKRQYTEVKKIFWKKKKVTLGIFWTFPPIISFNFKCRMEIYLFFKHIWHLNFTLKHIRDRHLKGIKKPTLIYISYKYPDFFYIILPSQRKISKIREHLDLSSPFIRRFIKQDLTSPFYQFW